MKATKIVQTCTACPTQYDISLEDGRMVYFRYRWGYLDLRISPQPSSDIMEAVIGRPIYSWEEGDSMDGRMDHSDALLHMKAAGIEILDGTPGADDGPHIDDGDLRPFGEALC